MQQEIEANPGGIDECVIQWALFHEATLLQVAISWMSSITQNFILLNTVVHEIPMG